MIKIYTDGACSGNPGPGGWSVIITSGEKVKVLSGHEIETTNNRMELTAILNALEWCAKKEISNVEIYSDSAYVVNAINQFWIKKWLANGWTNSKKEEVKNSDLWKRFIYYNKQVKAKFIKVKGHNKDTLNEMADKRAVEESMKAKYLAEVKT